MKLEEKLYPSTPQCNGFFILYAKIFAVTVSLHKNY